MPTKAKPNVIDSPGARKRDLAAIHMGATSLGLIKRDDKTDYLACLWSVCHVTSAAALDFTGRKRFLEHLRQCGWVQAGSGRGRAAKAQLNPSQRLIWSLWQQLADAGAVNDRRMPALASFIERQTGIKRIEWLNAKQENLVVESLKEWLVRVGKK
jgi:phage-related protein